MSRFAASGPGFAARRPTRSPHELRGDWIAAVEDAGLLAAEAAQHDDLPRRGLFGADLTRLMARLRGLERDNFPVAGDAARSFALAFLVQVKAFVAPSTPPQTRTACAPALKASARLLDQWLSELRSAEAVAGRRVLGEREDD